MAALKGKMPKQRRNKRRASSYRLPKTTVVGCPDCHESKLPHRTCPECGYCDGKEAISIED